MGKCMSAGSEQESGSANTDNLIEPDAIQPLENNKKDTNKDEEINGIDKIKKMSKKVHNPRSLSESDDDETEPLDVDKKHTLEGKRGEKKENNNSNKTEKEREEKEKEKEKELSLDINYISPTSIELSAEYELELAHISHRGHYLNEGKYSAQNMLQSNESYYVSLPSYNFNEYDATDNDWFIFKICSNNLIKITSLYIKYANQTNIIEQYPSKILIQFMQTNSLKNVLTNSSQWTEPYIISPHPLCTTIPCNNEQSNDKFTISISEQYLNKLINNKCDQYIKISFIDNHKRNEQGNEQEYDGDKGKYAIHQLKVFGIDLIDKETNKNIILENTVSQQIENANYKVDIDNNNKCKLSPKPGKNDARVMMREHIFFVNIESKTILKLKQSICDEYNRMNSINNKQIKYEPKQLLLIEAEFGLINDMMDCTYLNKRLTDIGIKPVEKKFGYYITVAFC